MPGQLACNCSCNLLANLGNDMIFRFALREMQERAEIRMPKPWEEWERYAAGWPSDVFDDGSGSIAIERSPEHPQVCRFSQPLSLLLVEFREGTGVVHPSKVVVWYRSLSFARPVFVLARPSKQHSRSEFGMKNANKRDLANHT